MLTLSSASRLLLISALLAVMGVSACSKKKGHTDSGGGNAPAPTTPAPAPNNPAPATPSASPFKIYNDAGGVLGEPEVLLFTGGALTIAELSGGAPEGTKYLRATDCVPGAFWGVTMDEHNTGAVRNLSALAGASLKFNIRVDRALAAGERLVVNLTDGNGTTQSILLTSAVGFDPTRTGSFQQVAIPISSYSQIDKTRIRVPFAIAVDSPAGTAALTIDIDDVQWAS